MNFKQIIDKYLPMLQDLQTKVADKGNPLMTMEIRVGRDYLLGDITLLKEDNSVDRFCHQYFFDGQHEQFLDGNMISLNAFFGSLCMTTVTGVDCVIYHN